jgi:hypothetical protein
MKVGELCQIMNALRHLATFLQTSRKKMNEQKVHSLAFRFHIFHPHKFSLPILTSYLLKEESRELLIHYN